MVNCVEEQLLGRLNKVRDQINLCTDYISLERASTRLDKIKGQVAGVGDRKTRGVMNAMVEGMMALIKERGKLIKRGVLATVKPHDTDDLNGSLGHNKTLKHVKSVQGLQDLMHPRKYSKEKRSPSPTMTKDCSLSQLVMAELQQLNGQLADLSGPAVYTNSPYTAARVRELTFSVEEGKTRIKNLEEQNQQLKNRLLNEQRRQEDYISSLKQKLQHQQAAYAKEAKAKVALEHNLETLSSQKGILQAQVEKLHRSLDTIIRSKNEVEKMLAETRLSNQVGMKRELQSLSKQDQYLKEVQMMLHRETTERKIMEERFTKVVKDNQELVEQVTELEQKLDETLGHLERVDEANKKLSAKVTARENQLQQEQLKNAQLHRELDYLTRKQVQKQHMKALEEHQKLQKIQKLKTLFDGL